MRRCVAGRAPRGFTLIEVLVAMLLLSLLVAGAWGGIHTAVKAIHAGDTAIERVNRLRVTQQFLRRQLSHALPLAFGRDKDVNVIFEGERDSMRFVAPMPGYLSSGGAYVQALRLERRGPGLELTFQHHMLNGYSEDDAKADPAAAMLLIGDLADGQFMYRGLDDEGELGDWTDHWEDPDKLPVMVRINFRMAPDSGLTWPVMDIPLMMDVGSLPRGARQRMNQMVSQEANAARAAPPPGPDQVERR